MLGHQGSGSLLRAVEEDLGSGFLKQGTKVL